MSAADTPTPWALGESLYNLALRLNFAEHLSKTSDKAKDWLGDQIPEALRDFPNEQDKQLARTESQYAKELNNFRNLADQAVRQFVHSGLPKARFEVGEAPNLEAKHRHEYEEAVERLNRLAFEVDAFRRVLSAVGKAEEAAADADASAQRAQDAVQLATRDHLRQDVSAAARVLMGLSAALTALGAATLSGRDAFPEGYASRLTWVLGCSGAVVALGLAIAVGNARRSARAARQARQAADVEIPGAGTWSLLGLQLLCVIAQGTALVALLQLLVGSG